MREIRQTTTNVPMILKEQGRSVGWFCRQVGIHRSYYWMMEHGHRPVAAFYLARAAEVLGVPAALLAVDRSSQPLFADERETRTAA